ARRTGADLEALLRDPQLTPSEQGRLAEAPEQSHLAQASEQSRLAQSLVVVYGHLGPAERTAHSNTLLESHSNTILAVLRNPKNNLALATRVQFADSLVALCVLLDPPEAGRVFDALLPTLSDFDVQQFRLRDGPIKKVISRLEEADLRR